MVAQDTTDLQRKRLLNVIAEMAIASGVRRIEALTGAAAEAYLAEEEGVLREAAAAVVGRRPSRISVICRGMNFSTC